MTPMTLWMQSSLFWVRLFKQQQDAYLRMLGQFAEKIPHESAADLSREAEAMKDIASTAKKPASKAKSASTPKAVAELEPA